PDRSKPRSPGSRRPPGQLRSRMAGARRRTSGRAAARQPRLSGRLRAHGEASRGDGVQASRRLAGSRTRGDLLDRPRPHRGSPSRPTIGGAMSRERLVEHRQIWAQKPVLAQVYGPWFEALLAEIPAGGRALEVGAGPGFLAEEARRRRRDARLV